MARPRCEPAMVWLLVASISMAVAQGVGEVQIMGDGYGGEIDGVERMAQQDDNDFEEDILSASSSAAIDDPKLGESDREAIAAVELQMHPHSHPELGESTMDLEVHANSVGMKPIDAVKLLVAKKRADAKHMMENMMHKHSVKSKENSKKSAAKASRELAESNKQAQEAEEKKKATKTFEQEKKKADQAAEEESEAEDEVKKAEGGSFDPTAAGAEEKIMNLKDKISVMKKKKAYAEQVAVVDSMNEMQFKVRARSPEAVKAKATVDDVEEGVPSVNGAVEERLKKSRDKYKMKELSEKSKPPADPEAEGWDTLNQPKKKQNPLDKMGAAAGVILRAAVNDAKEALLHSDNNPGDKRSMVKAGEAMERVKQLTEKSQKAVEHDKRIHHNTIRELRDKADEVSANKDLARKKEDVKEQQLYADRINSMREKKFETESIELDIKDTQKQAKIDKRLGELAKQREQVRLKKARVVAAEAAQKKTIKMVEKDKLEKIKRKELAIKATENVKESLQKQDEDDDEQKKKDELRKLDAVKQQVAEKNDEIKEAKKEVVKIIQDVEKSKKKADKKLKVEEEAIYNQDAENDKKLDADMKAAKEQNAEDIKKKKKDIAVEVDTITNKKASAEEAIKKLKKEEAVLETEVAQESDKKAKAEIKAAKAKSEKMDIEKEFEEQKKAVKVKVSNYEDKLKAEIRKRVEAKYEAKMEKDAQSKMVEENELGEEMKSDAVQKIIAKRVAKKMLEKTKNNVYTVDQARQLEKAETAKEANRVRNKIWEKTTAAKKRATSKQHAVETSDDEVPEDEEQSGVFLKKKKIEAMKAQTIPEVEKKQQMRIQRIMDEEREREEAAKLDALKSKKGSLTLKEEFKIKKEHELVQRVLDAEGQKEALAEEKREQKIADKIALAEVKKVDKVAMAEREKTEFENSLPPGVPAPPDGRSFF